MLIAHISFSLGLIALVAGVSLYLWSVRAEAGPGVALAKIFGVIVIILAILELICSVYSGVRWKHYKQEWHEKKIEAPASTSDSSANTTPEESSSTSIQLSSPDLPAASSQDSTQSSTQPKSSS